MKQSMWIMFHQANLGVLKTIMDILWGIALVSINSKIFSSLNQCPFHIKKHSKYPSFWILITGKGGYFSSNANFVAFEHCFVMQVISIPRLVNILVGGFMNLEGLTSGCHETCMALYLHKHDFVNMGPWIIAKNNEKGVPNSWHLG